MVVLRAVWHSNSLPLQGGFLPIVGERLRAVVTGNLCCCIYICDTVYLYLITGKGKLITSAVTHARVQSSCTQPGFLTAFLVTTRNDGEYD